MRSIFIPSIISSLLISIPAFSQTPVYSIPNIDENVPEVEHLNTLPADPQTSNEVSPQDPPAEPTAPQGPIVGMVGQPSHFYEPVYERVVLKNQERYRFLGVGLDLGLPDGVAVGVVGKFIPWVSVGLYGTYFLAPGIRGTFTVDPINYPIAPTFTMDLGHMFPGKVPGVSGSPSIDYTYANIQPGIAFGSRDGFRFFIRGGMTHFSGTAYGLENVESGSVDMRGVSVSDPHFYGWVPSGKIGFTTLLF